MIVKNKIFLNKNRFLAHTLYKIINMSDSSETAFFSKDHVELSAEKVIEEEALEELRQSQTMLKLRDSAIVSKEDEDSITLDDNEHDDNDKQSKSFLQLKTENKQLQLQLKHLKNQLKCEEETRRLVNKYLNVKTI